MNPEQPPARANKSEPLGCLAVSIEHEHDV